MHIEPLDRQTVKVILSGKDMKQFSLTYENMDYEDPATRKVILRLLQKVQESTRLDFAQGKLFIEAFPDEEGGCILYLNLLTNLPTESLPKNGFHTPLIVSLCGSEEVIGLCKTLFFRYSHLILKSSLYKNKDAYILMIYSYYKQDQKLCAILHEYGDLLGRGEVAAGIIHEHARAILPSQAVERIAGHF